MCYEEVLVIFLKRNWNEWGFACSSSIDSRAVFSSCFANQCTSCNQWRHPSSSEGLNSISSCPDTKVHLPIYLLPIYLCFSLCFLMSGVRQYLRLSELISLCDKNTSLNPNKAQCKVACLLRSVDRSARAAPLTAAPKLGLERDTLARVPTSVKFNHRRRASHWWSISTQITRGTV